MKFVYLLVFAICSAHAFEFSLKSDISHNRTDNVNSSKTNLESDTYNTLSLTGQAKEDKYKFKVKYKTERYSKTVANNNYYVDLSANYRPHKNTDYTASFFKQTYLATPTIISDTTSDNTGTKFSANFAKDFSANQNGYISLSGTLKKFTNQNNRSDTIVDIGSGLEHYITENFIINPEIDLSKNSSSNSYYSTLSFGPLLSINYNYNHDLEFFSNVSYTYTKYADRNFDTTVRNRTISNQEHQTLVTTEIGITYYITKILPIIIKHSTYRNSSNNTSNEYNSKIFSFNLGIRI